MARRTKAKAERTSVRTRPDGIDSAVGNTLRQLRRVRGVSQSELARHLGVSFQQIQKYEGGVNRIGASALYRIAGFLDVAIGDLFAAAPLKEKCASGRSNGESRVVTVVLPNGRETPDIDQEEIAIAVTEFQKIADASLRAALLQLMRRLAVEPRRPA